MKIILAEENSNGGQMPEQVFNQAVVLVGRDVSADCDIAFENKKYPMVSRKHAELRYENGNWILHDLNSSYGTFIDNLKISSPQALAVGNQIQFGKNGPVLRVIWFEVAFDSLDNLSPHESFLKDHLPSPSAVIASEIPVNQQQKIVQHNIPNFDTSPKTLANNRKLQSETARLEFVGADAKPSFKLEKQTVWLGRDAACDVRTESSAQMVSRRHAEIRCESGDFVVYDNGSFNGTLINGQRISAPTRLYDEDRIELGIGGPVLQFISPARPAPKAANVAGQRSIPGAHLADITPGIERTGA